MTEFSLKSLPVSRRVFTSLESEEEHGELIRPLAISFPLYARKDVCWAKCDLYLQDSGGCLIFLFKDSIVTLATRHCGTDGKSNIQRLFEGDTYRHHRLWLLSTLKQPQNRVVFSWMQNRASHDTPLSRSTATLKSTALEHLNPAWPQNTENNIDGPHTLQ